MNRATLVIMAAGIGSRFGGGIKQLEPVGPNGEIIMDYSIADAMEAGFDKVVFVIRKDLEKDFKEVIGIGLKSGKCSVCLSGARRYPRTVSRTICRANKAVGNRTGNSLL